MRAQLSALLQFVNIPEMAAMQLVFAAKYSMGPRSLMHLGNISEKPVNPPHFHTVPRAAVS